MYCKNCGNKLNENDVYCSSCGAKKEIIISNDIINKKKKLNITKIIIAIVLFAIGVLMLGTWILFGPFFSYLFMIPSIILICSELKINKIIKLVITIISCLICIVGTPLIFSNLNENASNEFYELDDENLKLELGNYQIVSENIVDYECGNPCYSFRTKTKEYEISFKDVFNNNITFKMNDDWQGKISEYDKKDVLDIVAETQLRNNYNLNEKQIETIFNIDEMETKLDVSVKLNNGGTSQYNGLVKNYKNNISNCNYNFNFYVNNDFELTESKKTIINNKLIEIYKTINTCSIYSQARFYVENDENIKQIYYLNYNGIGIDWELSFNRSN